MKNSSPRQDLGATYRLKAELDGGSVTATGNLRGRDVASCEFELIHLPGRMEKVCGSSKQGLEPSKGCEAQGHAF